MLILGRKRGEKIIVETKEGTVEIVVMRLESGKVRLGIAAPDGVKILREELTKGKE